MSSIHSSGHEPKRTWPEKVAGFLSESCTRDIPRSYLNTDPALDQTRPRIRRLIQPLGKLARTVGHYLYLVVAVALAPREGAVCRLVYLRGCHWLAPGNAADLASTNFLPMPSPSVFTKRHRAVSADIYSASCAHCCMLERERERERERDWLTDWLTDWLSDWLTDWLTDWTLLHKDKGLGMNACRSGNLSLKLLQSFNHSWICSYASSEEDCRKARQRTSKLMDGTEAFQMKADKIICLRLTKTAPFLFEMPSRFWLADTCSFVDAASHGSHKSARDSFSQSENRTKLRWLRHDSLFCG